MGEIVRLSKYIAMCGISSRRGAETLIDEGRVSVNGSRVTEQGIKIEIGADNVAIDGEIIKNKGKKYYIMLNKPVGYVSSAKDQFDRPTVVELVKKDIDARIFPVGRLDYETEGLLFLTNDGDFTYKVTHPKFHMNKTYLAAVKGGMTVHDMNVLREGVKLDDGFKTSPAEAEITDVKNGYTFVRLTIHEGKNRQVRRMFEALGKEVAALQRLSIGKVELGNLPLGRWRHLTSHEVNYLMNS